MEREALNRVVEQTLEEISKHQINLMSQSARADIAHRVTAAIVAKFYLVSYTNQDWWPQK